MFYILQKHIFEFKEHNSLLNYCIQIDHLSKKLTDQNNIKMIKRRINELIPNYRFRKKVSEFNEKVSSIKNFIKKSKNNFFF